MQVAILAGGMANRLGEMTRKEPKSLLKILGRPFIEYQIEIIRKKGINNIVICTGHLGEKIQSYLGDGKRYGIKIVYSHEDRPLGTAGAMKKAENLLNSVFITMYGDSYLFLDFNRMLSHFVNSSRMAMMTVYKNDDRHDRSNTSVSGGMVTGYSKNGRTGDMVYIDYGAHVFRKEALALVPDNRFYPLEKLFPLLIKQKQLLAYEVRECFYEIGSLTGIGEFTEYIRGKS
jgi:NDP-sugar pyrophosphorylase family protein